MFSLLPPLIPLAQTYDYADTHVAICSIKTASAHTVSIVPPTNLRAPKRKAEYAASRALLAQIKNHWAEEKNVPKSFSISHSGDYCAVVVSEKNRVGIDLQKIDERLRAVRGKFLRPEEYPSTENAHEELFRLCVAWCAKEALYKYYSAQRLNFKAHIFIDPSQVRTDAVGVCSLRARLSLPDSREENPQAYIYYTRFAEEYVLLWVL